jgi:cellulose synthase/poly-beta-1,6-N-acetylglucosamine synthase-like glycosyltransferase
MTGLKSFLLSLDPVFLWYFAVINIMNVFLLILGTFKVYFRRKELRAEDFTPLLRSSALPDICFIIPLFNEGDHIITTVTNLLNLSYRYKQIIVVNDGSTDHGVKGLKEAFNLVTIPMFYQESLPTQPVRAIYRSKSHPELLVIDKEHGKKSDALNAGINACETQFFIGIDADTLIDDNGFKTCFRPFLSSDTIAVGGTVSIMNGCQCSFNRISTEKFPPSFISAMQSLEYLRSFLTRMGWDYGGKNFIISGAFCIFPKDIIVKAGGFHPSMGEDMEIIVRLHRIMKKKKLPNKIFYLPDPIAWTTAPSTWADLGKQRTRWHMGLLESLFFHKSMCFNIRYGTLAFVTYPFWLIGEALEPLMEVFGFAVIALSVILGILNVSFFLLLVNITLIFSFLFTVTCIFIEELSFQRFTSSKTIITLVIYSLFENFGYRQIYLWWKIRSFGRFFKTFPKVKKASNCIKKLVENCNCPGNSDHF